jgi:hypothetical protein
MERKYAVFIYEKYTKRHSLSSDIHNKVSKSVLFINIRSLFAPQYWKLGNSKAWFCHLLDIREDTSHSPGREHYMARKNVHANMVCIPLIKPRMVA